MKHTFCVLFRHETPEAGGLGVTGALGRATGSPKHIWMIAGMADRETAPKSREYDRYAQLMSKLVKDLVGTLKNNQRS